jgi:PDZ domain-containing protein
MSRQLRTLIIGAVLCLALALASLVVSVPYVVLGVGVTCNTLSTCPPYANTDIISVTGTTPRATSGHLNLTTVSENGGRTTAAQAIIGWLKHDEVVVPHDSVFPPGQSTAQVNKTDTQEFTDSQDSATAAAACELGYPKGFGIVAIEADSVNKATLKVGDAFVTVNGHAVTNDTSLQAALANLPAGSVVPAHLIRDKVPVTVQLKLGPPADGSTKPLLGISVSQTCLLPFQVTLQIGDIGGPSAGMMFALGIIDKVGPTDLTQGKFIAGTGTIDPTGAVGAIGGIALKMLGARRQGATVFLAPQSNCSDVRGNIPSGLDVVAVSTLHDAVTDLKALAAGQAVPHC